MILALTSRGDLTTDYVVRALESAGAMVVRLNTNDLLSTWRVRITPDELVMQSGDRTILPEQVRAVYYRRARAPEPPPEVDHRALLFTAREGNVVLRALYAALRCPWISHYAAIAAAENKPRQLALAHQLGFSVPETLITNDPALAHEFFRAHGTVATKALSYGDLGDGDVLHTTIIEAWEDGFAEAVRAAPTLLQAYIEKEADYRVTVVDEHVFACRIASQGDEKWSVDMRRGLADPRMEHMLITLPLAVTERCVALVRALDLRFGAIDLACDREGRFWFLEVNPNGQWAWIEDRTGAPISQTIAAGLLRDVG